MTEHARQPYSGSTRRLLLAFDVGTTYSGISYSVLNPGEVPEIKVVKRFPAQRHITTNSYKIPTIIYYDSQGGVKAVGAEALKDDNEEMAEEGNWHKAEWFKLRLRPKEVQNQPYIQYLPPLPPNKTIVDVFADFIAYLFHCARKYIEEISADGRSLWQEVESTEEIHFVFSHPNGWGGREQKVMRRAAAQARLIRDTPAGQRRLTFVTEGEACLHFAVESGLLTKEDADDGIIIVDCGGGTIDLSAYRRPDFDKKRIYEEISMSSCHFQGSVFVSTAARMYLEDALKDSPYLADITHIVNCFDNTTKMRFVSKKERQYIKFGSSRDNDPSLNIVRGQIRVDEHIVANFFQPAIDCIIQSVVNQKNTAQSIIKRVLLIGGFSSNDWLFDNVQVGLQKFNLNVIRPEENTTKAVSEGALSSYLDHYVRFRVAKVTYGKFTNIEYDSDNADHIARESSKFTRADGTEAISGYFSTILSKAHIFHKYMERTKEFRASFAYVFKEKPNGELRYTEIWCYRGPQNPSWRDVDEEHYTLLCSIEIHLAQLPFQKRVCLDGDHFWRAKFDVVLFFGRTELQAQVAWKKNGIERRSPAQLVFDDE
ncbi:hypothetical protein CPB83DRAFT_817364 [Crepidotus variabilis]|uniref:Uncharacterized protein n=1 Tax=Crepidotus variabilis TaxID=179855 RepID=A0A9P6EB79_9AGAR|nr:hypothetical protein CPB83DRAFT_817364 [Crepidotus variabilis]